MLHVLTHSSPTRRSSDCASFDLSDFLAVLLLEGLEGSQNVVQGGGLFGLGFGANRDEAPARRGRAAELRKHIHGERFLVRTDRKSTRLNSVTNSHLVCRLLLEKKKHTHI